MEEHERSKNVHINPQQSISPRQKLLFDDVERVAYQQAAMLIKNFGIAPEDRKDIAAFLLDVMATRFNFTFEGVEDTEDESELDWSDFPAVKNGRASYESRSENLQLMTLSAYTKTRDCSDVASTRQQDQQ
jgi:hypothetical protein